MIAMPDPEEPNDADWREAARLVRLNVTAHKLHRRSRGRFGWPKSEWWHNPNGGKDWFPMPAGAIAAGRRLKDRAFTVPSDRRPGGHSGE